LISVAAARAAGPDPYATSITLSDGAAGAPASLTFSFRATGSSLEKVAAIDIRLPQGTAVHPDALARTCPVAGTGPKAGAACPTAHSDARVGDGEMTVEMLGMHTVSGDVYAAEGAPAGANLAFFFPAGQVFGVGPQTIFGTLSPDGSRIQVHDIQAQLDLPFGATAELEKGRVTLSGEGRRDVLSNPTSGSVAAWTWDTRLSWSGGEQTQTVRAQVAAREDSE
jgi:hypothetical protein